MKHRRSLQLELRPKGHGGVREGAGRKKVRGSGVPHLRRPALAARHPVHVTMKVRAGLPSLRGAGSFPVVRSALKAARRRLGIRLVHYSVQSNHLHLVVEAADVFALGQGIKGLAVRLARRLNAHFGTNGVVFPDRFHAHVLRSPSEVRNALGYVVHNFAHHLALDGYVIPRGTRDLLSSAAWLTAPPLETAPVVAAETWLLSEGWKRARTNEPTRLTSA